MKKWLMIDPRDGAYRGFVYDEYNTMRAGPALTDDPLPDEPLALGYTWRHFDAGWQQVEDTRGVWLGADGKALVLCLLTDAVPPGATRPAQLVAAGV